MKDIITAAMGAILPRSVKDRLFGLGYRLSPDRFREFSYRYAFAPMIEYSLPHIGSRGFSPKFIVDIGAFEGDWSRLASSVWPDADILMVEANPEKAIHLQKVASDINAELQICLLGPQDGVSQTFFVMESGSSVLEENSPLDRRSIVLQQTSLDRLIGGRKVDFLKLDVQGFELEVLRGAEAALQSAQAVQLEVSLIQVNRGAPLFAEVVQFMADRGFEVADVLELHRRPLDKATNQLDLLFVPKGSQLLADTRHFA